MPSFSTRDPVFRQMLEMAGRAARTQAGVLLTGESGTGKNRLARHIHDKSPRADSPFVEVACANLPADLLESVLFGHEKGSFTDAHETHRGRFEQAAGGTLYFDEVQELQIELQAKVLRAIDEKRFERLGSGETLEIDFRVIASTREDPGKLVEEGRLREDLYYRMNVVRLNMPPLRQRPSDIMPLAEEFLREAIDRHGLDALRFGEETAGRLRDYAWPGNIRELRHAVESAAVLAADNTIMETDLPRQMSIASGTMLQAAARQQLSLGQLETMYIKEVLARTGGNKSAAARILGIHRKTLHEKLRGGDRG